MAATYNQTFAVDDPEIDDIMDERTGDYFTAAQLIGSDWELAMQTRMRSSQAIAAGKERFLCALCNAPVYLIAQMNRKKLHFRHTQEDGSCPAITRGDLSADQINAIKFHGQRESEAHLRMKAIIAESLERDPRFSCVQIEQTWKGAEKNERRRPDVCAVYDGRLPVAFEVQLSTTFLRVMAERRNFYLKEGGLLFWVFKSFDAQDARMTQQDVFFNNNRNIFLAGEETLQASLECGSLMLQGHWHRPMIERGQIHWVPERKMVRFDEITFDLLGQRAFYFDADAARIDAERKQRTLANAPLRNAFESCFVAYSRYEVPYLDTQKEWTRLTHEFKKFGLELPDRPGDKGGLRYLLQAAYSAKLEKAVGTDHADLVKLGHHLVDRQPQSLWIFRLMLGAYGRAQHMVDHDPAPNRKWSKKAKAYKQGWLDGDPAVAPDRGFDALLVFLFPEVAENLVREPRDVLDEEVASVESDSVGT
jgi:competence CoiA-like predicted nuclease